MNKMNWTIFLSLLAAVSFASSGFRPAFTNEDPAFPQLKQRPLNLPRLGANQPCPVSHGSHDKVPHVGYIFCSSCFWFGKGPVFFALPFQNQQTDEARFALTTVPRDDNAYSAKTPWVSRPEYAGPILVRGQRLDGGSRDKLRFGAAGLDLKVSDALELSAPVAGRVDQTQWSFWPTGIYVPQAGCYGLQIDTKDATNVVVFETKL